MAAAPPIAADLERKSRRVSTAALVPEVEKEKAAAVPMRRVVPRMSTEVKRMLDLRLFSLTVWLMSMYLGCMEKVQYLSLLEGEIDDVCWILEGFFNVSQRRKCSYVDPPLKFDLTQKYCESLLPIEFTR